MRPTGRQNDADRVWELTIQPRPKLKKGEKVRLVVTYGGGTTWPEDIDGFLRLGDHARRGHGGASPSGPDVVPGE